MIPPIPKYAFVTLLVAATTIRGSPLVPRQVEPVLERGLFNSIGNLIDKAKSGVGNAVGDAGKLLDIRSDDLNHTPTLSMAKDVFAELSRGALYANAAYCSAGSVKSWSCGATCEALGDIQVALTGGDNKEVPDCKWEVHLSKNHCCSYFSAPVFIAFDPSIQSVVVATQGTDPTQLSSFLTDAELLQDPLNLTNFPSAPPTAKVHHGFQRAFE